MIPLGNGQFAGKGGKIHAGTPDGLRPERDESHIPSGKHKDPPMTKKQAPPAPPAKKSASLKTKLENKLREFSHEIPDIDLEFLLRQATSNAKFENEKAFRRHLSEGALLNVNKWASSYLGIPFGEYMVYHINSDKATLVPTSLDGELVEDAGSFDVLTPSLLQHWDKIERCLAEDNKGAKELVQQQHSKYPRNRQLRGAIEASGMSQEEYADSIGVDPSTISRWTIDHEDGGRKPSIDHAVQLSKLTGQDVQSLFGSVVDDKSSPSSRRKSTSGSGKGRNPTYRSGNSG